MGHFYMITTREKMSEKGIVTKLGIAEKPGTRISQMQVGSTEGLSTLAVSAVKNPRALEKLMHSAFKDKRVRGEWYELTSDDIRLIYDNLDNIETHCECKACHGFYAVEDKRDFEKQANCLEEGCKYNVY